MCLLAGPSISMPLAGWARAPPEGDHSLTEDIVVSLRKWRAYQKKGLTWECEGDCTTPKSSNNILDESGSSGVLSYREGGA